VLIDLAMAFVADQEQIVQAVHVSLTWIWSWPEASECVDVGFLGDVDLFARDGRSPERLVAPSELASPGGSTPQHALGVRGNVTGDDAAKSGRCAGLGHRSFLCGPYHYNERISSPWRLSTIANTVVLYCGILKVGE
jgi:hypothetical protein